MGFCDSFVCCTSVCLTDFRLENFVYCYCLLGILSLLTSLEKPPPTGLTWLVFFLRIQFAFHCIVTFCMLKFLGASRHACMLLEERVGGLS